MKKTTEATSQEKRITAHMLKGKTITSLQALKLFGCLRLASRINAIKQKHTITREWQTLPNGKRVRKYGIAF